MGNLHALGFALYVYEDGHDGTYPATFQDLSERYVKDEAMFECPGATDAAGGYLYVPGLSTQAGPEVMIVFDRADIHPDGRHVLTVGGDVATLSEEDFQKRYEEQRAKYNLPTLKELAGERPVPPLPGE